MNVFHRRIDRIERDLDANETAQRSSQREQDGSEIRSLELERLIAQGLTLIERRNSFEFLRDAAAELFGIHTRSGVAAAHRLDGQPRHDHRGDDRQPRVHQCAPPRGRAGAAAEGHQDWLRRRRRLQRPPPHLGRARQGAWPSTLTWCCCTAACPRGAEKIAACWADARKVPQVVFKPDWTRHQKAAPFKRNDQLLEALPIGVIVFPGSGVTDNLADKAKALGIPLFDFRNSGCGA